MSVGERAPENGVRHPDEIETDRDAMPKLEIDQQLHRKITRDPFTRVIHRARGRADSPLPDQTNQAATQIFPFEKHEDDQEQNQTRRAQRTEQSGGRTLQQLRQPALRFDDPHRHRVGVVGAASARGVGVGSVEPAGASIALGNCFCSSSTLWVKRPSAPPVGKRIARSLLSMFAW